jgi:hypothetical protein
MCDRKDINKSLTTFRNAVVKMQQDITLTYLKNPRVGLSMQGWEVDDTYAGDFAELDTNATFYYYVGPLDEKTRPFCKEMLLLGKFFSQDDIDFLSLKLGYDVFLYEGSYNCRHKWNRARIKGKIQEGYVPPQPSASDLDNLDQIQEDSGLAK